MAIINKGSSKIRLRTKVGVFKRRTDVSQRVGKRLKNYSVEVGRVRHGVQCGAGAVCVALRRLFSRSVSSLI